MRLLTKPILEKLIANGEINNVRRKQNSKVQDFPPAVKFFCPWGPGTWLISEIIAEGEGLMMFGLCDLGMGSPELRPVMLSELQEPRGPGGLAIERDVHWTAKAPLSTYARLSQEAGRIVDRLPSESPKEKGVGQRWDDLGELERDGCAIPRRPVASASRVRG